MPRPAPVTNATFASDIARNLSRWQPSVQTSADALTISTWRSANRVVVSNYEQHAARALIVAIFAALAMTVFVNARAAFAQDVEDSGAGADANWERTGPAHRRGRGHGRQGPGDSPGDVRQGRRVGPLRRRRSRMPTTTTARPSTLRRPVRRRSFDDDTASSAAPDQDWGTADDYQNEPGYGIPYADHSLRR